MDENQAQTPSTTGVLTDLNQQAAEYVLPGITETLTVPLTGLDPDQRLSLVEQLQSILDGMLSDDGQVHAAGAPASVGENRQWTRKALDWVLGRLQEEEAYTQVKVIRQALRHNGSISRRDVYAIGGYEDDRSLRGFTRPINRLVRDAVDKGILAPQAERVLLKPAFSAGVAYQFDLPKELVRQLAAA